MAKPAKSTDDIAALRGQMTDMAADIRKLRDEVEKLSVGVSAFQSTAILQFSQIKESIDSSAAKRTTKAPGAAAAAAAPTGSIKVTTDNAALLSFPARKQWFTNSCNEGLEAFVANYGIDGDALNAEKKAILAAGKITEGDAKFKVELIGVLWTKITAKTNPNNKALQDAHQAAKDKFTKEKLTPADN